MKKLRIGLSAAAIVFAFGAAFATQFRAQPLNDAYEFVPATQDDPARCEEIETTCSLNGTTVCTLVNGHEVREISNVQSQCGQQLKRP